MRAPEGGNPLLYLYSNNSIETSENDSEGTRADYIVALTDLLTPYHKKQAHTLHLNVKRLIEKEAISPNHVGFLTLTFPDNVTDNKEASRRFNSFKTNFLAKHPEFGHWVYTKEQQKRGAWHYHLVICLQQDIKTGLEFEEIAQRKYSSASPYLRKLWQDLRQAMPKYGFGRSELLPIKSNADAMARYIGKYISKHIGQRDESSKGVRLVNYSRGWAKNSMKFVFFTENSKEWRKKVALFAKMHGCQELYQLSEKLGSDWAYRYIQEIYNVYQDSDLVAKNKDKVYRSVVVEHIEKKQKARLKSMMSNLTIHSGKSKKKRDLETQKIELWADLPHMVEHYVRKTKITEVPF